MTESPLVRLVDRYFVWVVVLLAVLETVGQTFDSWHAGHLASAYVWASIAVVMVTGTYGLEIVKSGRNAS